MPKIRRSTGGLIRGNLFDTNIKATSIDEDIFSDQELLDELADDSDLVLVLDVSETPDKIKYVTKTNLIGEGLVSITNNTNNYLMTGTGSALSGEANLTFDGTILNSDGGEINLDISSGDPHMSFQIGGSDKFTLGVDDSDSDKFKIDSGDTVGGSTLVTLDSSGMILAGDLTVSGDDLTMGTNTSGYVLVADGTNFNPVAVSGDITMASDGAVALGSGVVVDADVNASAAIAISKTALTAGTNISLSTNTLNVDDAFLVNDGNDATTGTITSAGLIVDGNKNVTPGDGAFLHLDTATVTDSNTSGSGTATKYTHVNLEAPTLAATNASVTTSDAATLYINAAATAGTNQTITRNWAMWVDTGNARFDGSIYSGTTHAMNSSGVLQVASQTNITGVGTIATGVWEGTDVGVAHGGTGASTATAGFDALSPMTAEGDILYGGSSGTITKLAKGSDADVLTLASGIPSWATPTVGDVTSVTAGVGLSGGGSSGDLTITLDLSELSTVTPADGDFFSTLDSDGANEQKTTTTALATLFAGTGLTASSSVIGVDAAQTQITSVGTIGTGTWEATDVAVAHGGTGASTATAGFDALSPMTAEGDILYGGTSGTVTKLAKGSDGEYLKLASGVPSWASVSSAAVTALNSATANELVTVGSTTTELDAETNLTYSSDVLATASSSANLPRLDITNTHADATAGMIKFIKDPGSGQGADNDIMGTITWYGTDASNNAPEELARMEAYIIEADHATEAGGIKFYVAENDATMTAGLQILGVKDQDGEIDVTIGAGTASTTIIAGTLTMGSTAAMTNAGLLSVADQSGITGLGTISSGTWNGTAITHAYINDDIVSGQAEITSGFAAADELMYSDGGVIKRVGLDTMATKLFSVATAGVVAQADDHMLFLDGGATGDVIVESIDDFLSAIAGSGISVSSSQLTASGGAVTALNNATADELVTVGSTTTELDAETNLTYASDLLTIASSSVDLPRIDITNTHADATAGKIRFNKDTSSGEDGDVMGTIEFFGTDAAENTHQKLAYIDSYIIDSAEGSEAAGLRFYVAENDATNTLGLQILGQADDNGEVDVTIGAGAASTTTIAGTLTMGSTAALTNAGLVAVTDQSNIAGVGTITSGTWQGTAIASGYIANDAIDSQHYADGSIDNAHIADDQIDSEHYADGSIDFAHIQDVAANSILGRDANSSGVLSEVALATTQILIGDGTGFTAAALSGDATMSNAGVVAIASDVIVNADIKSDAAIDMSKTALTAGTGLTLSTNTLNVDASQTGITAVGTIDTGTWEATDVTVSHGGTGVSTLLANAVLTGNGTSAIQAESDLLFSSNKLIPTASAHNAAGTALTMSAGATTAGTTNNIAGGALTFEGGQGKGSGAGGDIVFKTANAGGSGSSLNALATALTLSDDLSATFAGAVDLGSNTLTSTGSMQIRTIDYSDGDLSMTIADGGGVTFAQNATFSGVLDITDATDSSDATGDTGALRTEGGASIAKKLYVGTDLDVEGTAELDNITIGGAQGSDGQVLTSTGSGVGWEDAGGGGDSVDLTREPSEGVHSGITASFVAGEALSSGEVVYFKQADSKMWKAVATAEATSRCVAMAADDISADATGLFLMSGFMTDNGTFPDYSASSGVGKPVYTPEAETSGENVPEKTPPDSDGDFVQVIGFVVAANTLYFNPSQDIIEHA